jgi:Phosphotransferase System HPr (HPr) Family
MKSFKYIVKEAVGIHARPATLLVKEAASYASSVIVESCGKKADAKGLLGLMALGVKCSQEVTFLIEGDDEEAAAKGLQEFCICNL